MKTLMRMLMFVAVLVITAPSARPTSTLVTANVAGLDAPFPCPGCMPPAQSN